MLSASAMERWASRRNLCALLDDVSQQQPMLTSVIVKAALYPRYVGLEVSYPSHRVRNGAPPSTHYVRKSHSLFNHKILFLF